MTKKNSANKLSLLATLSLFWRVGLTWHITVNVKVHDSNWKQERLQDMKHD